MFKFSILPSITHKYSGGLACGKHSLTSDSSLMDDNMGGNLEANESTMMPRGVKNYQETGTGKLETGDPIPVLVWKIQKSGIPIPIPDFY